MYQGWRRSGSFGDPSAGRRTFAPFRDLFVPRSTTIVVDVSRCPDPWPLSVGR